MTQTDQAPVRLMFDWAHDHRRRLALWLIIAVLLHIGAYFLFRIVQPAAAPAPTLDTAIHVLAPGSPEAARLAPFIAANDPSLVAPDRIGPVEIPDPTIPPYQPGYAAAPPPIAPLPDPQPRLLPPIVRDVGPVPMPNIRSTLVIPAPARETTISFSGGLENRKRSTLPDPGFPANPGDALPAAVFLLKVDPAGGVVHVFQQESTGNRELDLLAAGYLSGLRFDEAPGPAWGTAIFHWGMDVKREEVE